MFIYNYNAPVPTVVRIVSTYHPGVTSCYEPVHSS